MAKSKKKGKRMKYISRLFVGIFITSPASTAMWIYGKYPKWWVAPITLVGFYLSGLFIDRLLEMMKS